MPLLPGRRRLRSRSPALAYSRRRPARGRLAGGGSGRRRAVRRGRARRGCAGRCRRGAANVRSAHLTLARADGIEPAQMARRLIEAAAAHGRRSRSGSSSCSRRSRAADLPDMHRSTPLLPPAATCRNGPKEGRRRRYHPTARGMSSVVHRQHAQRTGRPPARPPRRRPRRPEPRPRDPRVRGRDHGSHQPTDGVAALPRSVPARSHCPRRVADRAHPSRNQPEPGAGASRRRRAVRHAVDRAERDPHPDRRGDRRSQATRTNSGASPDSGRQPDPGRHPTAPPPSAASTPDPPRSRRRRRSRPSPRRRRGRPRSRRSPAVPRDGRGAARSRQGPPGRSPAARARHGNGGNGKDAKSGVVIVLPLALSLAARRQVAASPTRCAADRPRGRLRSRPARPAPGGRVQGRLRDGPRDDPPDEVRPRRGPHPARLVQHRGRPAGAPAAVLHPATVEPIGPADLAPLFPMALILQEVSHRPRDRDPRAGPRGLHALPAEPAVSGPSAREGARYAGAHLLQVRGRQPGRQPQAEHRAAAGLLQQGGGRRAAGDRDRRGPVGQRPGVRRRLLRPRGQGLHGPRELRPEAVPADPDGDLRRGGRRQPVADDELRPGRPRRDARHARLAGHRDLRGGRGRRDPRRHEVLARLGAGPRAAAPDGDRPGGDRADGDGRRGARHRHRLHGRRLELRRRWRSRSSARSCARGSGPRIIAVEPEAPARA